jgi:hypothetical protein
MLRSVLGVAVGILAAWLYRSERAREEVRRRLPTAPESLRQATKAAASATADRAERAAGAVGEAPVPAPLKDTLSRAATTVRAAAEKVGDTVPASGAPTATLSVQELPDGSWIGNVTWGGRTLNEGAPEAQVVMRRLAAHLVAMPEAGRPDTVKLIRVSQAGEREEREQELASLLG